MSDPHGANQKWPDLGLLQTFLFNEARLLDERRFEEWRDLFTDDGYYWMPLAPEQTEPGKESSIIYDDAESMETRIRRLRHPRAHAQIPASRTVHYVSNVLLDAVDETTQEYTVSSAVQMVEYRKAHQYNYAARCRHVLRAKNGTLRIASKRVDLINSTDVLPAMSIPI